MNKKAFFIIAFIILLCLTIEVLSFYTLNYLSAKKHIRYDQSIIPELSPKQIEAIRKILNKKEKLLTYDAKLGWSIKPNGSHNKYQANSQGIRSNIDQHTLSPADKITRITTFGDSFVHCDEVSNHETWQHFLQKKDPALEVINFGVSGYATDQSLLHFRTIGNRFNADFVIIGFMADNIFRNITTFRPFYTRHTMIPMSKPRFINAAGTLRLIENPLKQRKDYQKLIDDQSNTLDAIGKHDFYYHMKFRRNMMDSLHSVKLFKAFVYSKKIFHSFYTKDRVYNTDHESFRVTTKILHQFYQEALQAGSTPIILILPTEGELHRYVKSGPRIYTPLLDYLKANNLKHIDLADDFLQYTKPNNFHRYFSPGSHYSPEGNFLIAQFIHNRLKQLK